MSVAEWDEKITLVRSYLTVRRAGRVGRAKKEGAEVIGVIGVLDLMDGGAW